MFVNQIKNIPQIQWSVVFSIYLKILELAGLSVVVLQVSASLHR